MRRKRKGRRKRRKAPLETAWRMKILQCYRSPVIREFQKEEIIESFLKEKQRF